MRTAKNLNQADLSLRWAQRLCLVAAQYYICQDVLTEDVGSML